MVAAKHLLFGRRALANAQGRRLASREERGERIASGSEAAITQKGCDQYSDGRCLPSFTIIACGAIGADAATTSAFATLEFATVSADQTPNAVATTIPAKPMISSLRIVIVPSSRVKAP